MQRQELNVKLNIYLLLVRAVEYFGHCDTQRHLVGLELSRVFMGTR